MGDISPHFNRSEFACKCGCGFSAVDKELNAVLEDVRTHFNSPLVIDCACRCPSHNADVGGVADSQHVYGMAADIKVNGVSPDDVASYIEKAHPNGGVGRYDTFTHVDVRGYSARWNG
ncbi:Peptidase M15 [Buttiauxella agrestis]|uniref:Peptidase M15 n=1 Tax=Buttiauxella agrestis TaxID=82977 RepID=A0A381C635_9ENTR|nr:D-Ala-D-Ala carboxypeptidase family metallohydrolase [Buttiauxella agrestis]SUW63282.1 Peptidase M15 [Buttiauxella agrestis]